MLYNEFMQVIQRGLSISIDMRDNSAKDRRLIVRLGAQLGIEVLQLDLLAAEVVCEASEGRSFVLFTGFVFERVWIVALKVSLGKETDMAHDFLCAFGRQWTSFPAGSPCLVIISVCVYAQ